MDVKQINPDEARQLMETSGDVVYIDVRTPGEFENGHPPGAINIPVVFPDPVTRRMSPNPDFMSVVEAHVPKETVVIVGCQMGGRSQFAAELMSGAGYGDVSNMRGGFSGARSPVGELVTPGWLQLDFPVETRVGPRADYEELKKKSQLS